MQDKQPPKQSIDSEFLEENTEHEEQTDQAIHDELTQSDEKMLNDWTSLGLAASMFVTQKRLEARFAFNILDQVDTKALINTTDPSYFFRVRRAHGMEKTFKKEHILTGEKGKYQMDKKSLRRRTYTLVLARRVHRLANEREINMRIHRASVRYGLNEENNAKLRTSIKKWLLENPGGDINNAIKIQATNLYLAQDENIELSDLEDKKTREKLTKKHEEALESAHSQYLTDVKDARKQVASQLENEGVIERAEEAFNQILDESIPEPSPKSANNKWNYIIKGEKEPVETEKSEIELPSTPSSPKPSFDTDKTPITLQPTAQKKQSLVSVFLQRSSELFSRIQKSSSRVLNSINSSIGQQMGKIGSVVKNVFSKVAQQALNLTSKVIKNVAFRALDALGGLGTALQTVNNVISNIIGIDIADKAVKLVIIVILAIALAVPFLIVTLQNYPSMHLQKTSKTSTSVSINKKKWNKFEESFLLPRISPAP